MKKGLKIVLWIFVAIYVVIVGFLTACLLNFNDYSITEFGKKSLIIIEDDELEPNFKEGDLVVVTKNKDKDINVGDNIFFYNKYASKVDVNFTSIVDKKVLNEDTITETTSYTLKGDYELSNENVIGKESTAKVYHGLGGILKVLESRWGYLFCVVLPILFVFIYEIYAVVKEVRTSDKKPKKIVSHKEEDVEELK